MLGKKFLWPLSQGGGGTKKRPFFAATLRACCPIMPELPLNPVLGHVQVFQPGLRSPVREEANRLPALHLVQRRLHPLLPHAGNLLSFFVLSLFFSLTWSFSTSSLLFFLLPLSFLSVSQFSYGCLLFLCCLIYSFFLFVISFFLFTFQRFLHPLLPHAGTRLSFLFISVFFLLFFFSFFFFLTFFPSFFSSSFSWSF